ncbi:MAG: ATP-binding cassette domain-containing protein [Ilumatobacteraceae bacterium]|nr:ATP-binding cassette domain-containing protein [Ilumatobacteraceae bacterium]
MISVGDLTKRFGPKVAVDHLDFEVRPGVVTGFLGPNGSGKSTTMRCMLGLDRPEAGVTLFDGTPYHDLKRPLHEVGALLDAGYVHPGRSARNHLRWLAASNGIARSRIDEVLEMVGLTSVAGSRLRSYSLGMRQRLGLAGVLLGDPHTIILDEPANGLDPEGIRWIRDVLTHLARQGRTVLVSSHQLSEMALMAEDLVVIGQGRLIEQSTVASFVDRYADHWVRVQSPTAEALVGPLTAAGGEVTTVAANTLDIRGLDCVAVGEMAAQQQMVLHELSSQTGSLEDAFLKATAGAQDYTSTGLAAQ